MFFILSKTRNFCRQKHEIWARISNYCGLYRYINNKFDIFYRKTINWIEISFNYLSQYGIWSLLITSSIFGLLLTTETKFSLTINSGINGLELYSEDITAPYAPAE